MRSEDLIERRKSPRIEVEIRREKGLIFSDKI